MVGGMGTGAFLVQGSDVELTINQVGDGNLVDGGIYSASGSVTVTQTGDYNTATIIQQ